MTGRCLTELCSPIYVPYKVETFAKTTVTIDTYGARFAAAREVESRLDEQKHDLSVYAYGGSCAYSL